MTRFQIIAIRLLLLALVLVAWEVLPRNGVINPVLLPPLGDVLRTLVDILGRAQVHEAIMVTAAEVTVAFVIAVGPWQMPITPAIQSMLSGATFALWPVMWLVFNGLLLYNISVRSGRFEAFRSWMTSNLPNDRRVVLVVIGHATYHLLSSASNTSKRGLR